MQFVMSLRRLLRAPQYAIVAILSIAIGVSVNAVALTWVIGAIRPSYGFADPHRLLAAQHHFGTNAFLSGAEVSAIRDHLGSDVRWGAYRAGMGERAALLGEREGQSLRGFAVASESWHMLGVRPQLGRVYSTAEQRDGELVALLNDHAWRSRFGSDPQVVGSRIRVGSAYYTIVGVLPAQSSFPAGDADFAIPMSAADWLSNELTLVVRTPHGVEVQAYGAKLMSAVTLAVADRMKAANRPYLRVQLWADAMKPSDRTFFVFVQLAALALLLAVLANLSSVLVARALAQQSDFAVRRALGASTFRALLPLFMETVLVATLGFASALVLTSIGFHLLRSRLPAAMAVSMDISWIVIAFASALLALTCIALPAAASLLLARKVSVRAVIGSSRLIQSSRAFGNAQRVFVCFQAAVTATLAVLICGVIASMGVTRNDLAGSMDGTIRLTQNRSVERDLSSRSKLLLRELTDELRSVSGIRLVGASSAGQLSAIQVLPKAGVTDGDFVCNCSFGTPNTLEAINARLLSGVKPGLSDVSSQSLLVLDSASAEMLGGTRLVIGTLLRVPGVNNDTIVAEVAGVVSHLTSFSNQHTARSIEAIILKTVPADENSAVFLQVPPSEQARVLQEIRGRWQQLGGHGDALNAQSVADMLMERDKPKQVASVLALIIIACVTGIAAVGAFGVSSASAALRHRDMAIRSALGARHEQIVRYYGWREFKWIVISVLIGAVGGESVWHGIRYLISDMSAPSTLQTAVMLASVLGVLGVALVSPIIRSVRAPLASALRSD
jgi:hypothetical protein